MSIRYRLLAAGLLIAAVALAGLVVIDRLVALPQLIDVEDTRALADFRRAQAALDREAVALDTLLVDWAFWDDTYDYVSDRNERFARANLIPETFVVANVQVMVIYDLDGMPVWRGAFAHDGTPTSDYPELPDNAPPRWREILVGSTTRPVLDELHGLVRTANGFALIASRPLLRTNLSGPSRGTVVMLRALGPDLFGALRDATGIHFDLERLVVDAALDEPAVAERTDDRVVVAGAVADAFGAPVAQLRAELPRVDFHLLRTAARWNIATMGALLLVALALALWAFERLSVEPLLRLTRHAERLRRSGDYSLRIDSPRRDEIGTVSAQIDELMAEVERRTQELTRLSMIDPLTGLLNRRAFDLALVNGWQVMSRVGGSLSLLLCDLDHFKAYNDRYGHPAGDACLQRVGAVLRETARRIADGVYRIGGEEFAVVVPSADLEAARRLATRLTQAVLNLSIPHADSEATGVISISIGMAATVPRGDASERELIAAADQALYEAKHAGRNTIRPLPPGEAPRESARVH